MKKPDGAPPAPAQQVPKAVMTDEAAAFVGEFYSDELDSTWRIEAKKGILRMHRRWAEPRLLTAAGPDEFTAISGLRLRFERKPEGGVTGFTLDAGRVRGLHFEKKGR
jgi:hypothetical protein